MLEFLPLFPLQLVVFPNENLNLHIFEPRYVQLISEAEKQGTTFGIPAYLNGKLMKHGTEIELIEVSNRAEDGKMDVKTRGLGVFQIHKYYHEAKGKLYAGADIERWTDNSVGDIDRNVEIISLIEELFTILKINKPIPSDALYFKTFSMGHHVGFNIQQEYQFLSLRSELERQEYMFTHLTQLIPTVKEMEELRKRVQMNGHFKNIIPPKI